MHTSFLKKYLHKQQLKESEGSEAAIAYLASLDYLFKVNSKVAQAIVQELKDQRTSLKLIASENYSSLAVQLAMGNLLTDKYAEGIPGHRFYAGCENVDTLEQLAQDLLKALFRAEYAYVQPHSGADANIVAFWSILIHRIQSKELERLHKKSLEELTSNEYEEIRQQLVNQRLLGMSLNSGGHLTHGYLHNLSSKMIRSFFYEVDPQTEQLDYGSIAKIAREVRPLILLAGYSSHPRKINFAKMREIADEVGATLLVDMAHFAGLVAGGVFEGDFNPIPFAHVVTSTTHKTLRGPRGGIILSKEEFAPVLNKGCPLVLGGPLPHVIASKAVAFQEALEPSFSEYAHQIVKNAQAMAHRLQHHGIRLVTGGTENHLVILDISSLGITGRQAETALRKAFITTSRNAIPYDKNGPWYTSGIRIGTPALTSLGMKEAQMEQIADLIVKVLHHTRPAINEKTGQLSRAQGEVDEQTLTFVKENVVEILKNYPLYPEIDLCE